MTAYTPPDPNSSDIVEVLEYEARYVEIAITCEDECTENYALMCLSAAAEIKRLREEVKQLKGVRK